MEITFTKGKDHDTIRAIRDDGTFANITFPKKGWYPHDAVHVIVEKHFNLEKGFWGIVASGLSPEDVGLLAKQGGHASAKRASIPSDDLKELIFAERTVECFEAELWSKPTEFNVFKSILKGACRASYIEMPEFAEDIILNIRSDLKKSGEQWRSLAIGDSITMLW